MSKSTTGRRARQPLLTAAVLIAVVAVTIIGVVGYGAFDTIRTDRARAATATWTKAADDLAARHHAARAHLDELQAKLAASERLEADARGTVADDATVAALSTAVATAKEELSVAKRALGDAPQPTRPEADFWGGGLEGSVDDLAATDFTDAVARSDRALGALVSAYDAVEASQVAKLVADAQTVLDAAQAALDAAGPALASSTAGTALSIAIKGQAAAIAAAQRDASTAAGLPEQSKVVTEAQQQLAAAVDEAKAKARATSAKKKPAAATAADTAPAAGSAAPADTGVDYVETVWATGYGKQSQGLIYTCRGSNAGVNVTPWYGLPAIAQDVACGGHGFPQRAGATVRIEGPAAGSLAGTYRVEGVVTRLNGETQTTADLPRGYDLLFQTCVTNHLNMAVIGLTRID